MTAFVFTDSSGEEYTITFGWQGATSDKNRCTIVCYPNKWDGKSLAMCSFPFSDHLHVEDDNWWTKEFLSLDTKDYINKLIKNKAYW